MEKQRQVSPPQAVPKKSTTRLLELDKMAVHALKAGDLFVHTRPSTGKEVLAQAVKRELVVLTKRTNPTR